MSEASMTEKLVECLSQQIAEYELLKSMYPGDSEILLTDKGTLDEIHSFISSPSEYVPSNLEFIVNLIVDHKKLEVCINLPLSYPNEEPDIYLRCNQLNRQQETSLNIELTDFIKSSHNKEVCLYTVISWLQDNIDIFAVKNNFETHNSLNEEENIQPKVENKFVRLWIYSHHIYNKRKREEILKKSKDLALTGFCLPGKPGVVCIEGEDSACQEWWRDIKSMTWKKIMIRKTETFDMCEMLKARKFNNFVEICFKTPTNSKHANMSEFAKYMNEHGCSQIFIEIFGLCNDR